MQTYDAITQLAAQVPGCPEQTLIRAYLDAARELCRRALVRRRTVTGTTSAGQTNYTLTPATDEEIIDVSFCSIDDQPIRKITYEQAVRLGGKDLGRVEYFNAGLNTVKFFGTPAGGETYEMRINSQPIRTAATISDSFVNRWGETIELGAMARIFRMAGMPWSTFDGSRFMTVQFEEALELARSQAADNDMHGIKRTVKYGGY